MRDSNDTDAVAFDIVNATRDDLVTHMQ